MQSKVEIQQRKVRIPTDLGIDDIFLMISREMKHSSVILSSDFVYYFERMTRNFAESEAEDGCKVLSFIWPTTVSTPCKSIQIKKINEKKYKVLGLRHNNVLCTHKISDHKPETYVGLKFI